MSTEYKKIPDLGNFWIMEAPVLSTSHITKLCSDQLDEYSDNPNYNIHSLNAGWMIFVGEDADNIEENFLPELKAVMAWTQAQEYTWLRLDTDGEVVDDLPTFDW